MTIKWTGSKKWLLPVFRSMDVCYEPFAGSASVSLTHAKEAYLNDTCLPLINMYKELALRKNDYLTEVRDLFDSIQGDPDPRAKFYEVRNNFKSTGEQDPVAFLAILYAGFNGLWRASKNGCNVPYGGPRRFPFDKLLITPSDKIKAATCLSWEHSLPDLEDEDAVIYADAPYSSTFTSYTPAGWTITDDIKLVKALGKRKNPVIISCLKTDANERNLKAHGFDFVTLGKLYSNGQKKAKRVEEILAFNDRGINFIKFSELQTS